MIQMYEYQKGFLNLINTAFLNLSKVLAVIATGLGKTIVAAFWAKEQIGKGRGLVLCDNNDILEQDLKSFRKVLGQVPSLGVFHGQEKVLDEVNILFASFQTFRQWKNAFFPEEFDFVIIDESHHSKANTFEPVVKFFKPKKLLALTATPDRMDGKDIRELFGEEVIDCPLEEGIANGWLTPVEYHLISDNLNSRALKRLAREVLEEGKRISLKQLNETIFIKARDEKIAEIIVSYNKKTIIFCESILHAENFQKFLPTSKVFHSKKSFKENSKTLEDFRDGRLQLILAVDKFNEGIDVPDAEMVVFLRCTDSLTIFLQQLGRGLRKVEGKEKVVVLDFVANCDRLAMVREMAEKVKKFAGNGLPLEKSPLHISGKAFDFFFDDEQKDIFKIIKEIQKKLYISDIPRLLAEYSSENPLPANQVLAGTHQKFLWICSKCKHKWEETGTNRFNNGSNCPACANRIVTVNNNLAITHPHLAKEYSPENSLPVNQVYAGMHRKFKWICSVCDYRWQATGNQRIRGKGTGCPACANRVVTSTNNMQVTHPNLAKEYDPDNELPANKIVAGTAKRLKWICLKCRHKWETTGNLRAKKGTGCPNCEKQTRVARRKQRLSSRLCR